ncbi:SOS response-associated peptidase [Sphingomonas hankookensis]
MAHLALAIARESAWRRPTDGTALRLALRVLAHIGVDRHLLTEFWESAFVEGLYRHHVGPNYDSIVRCARDLGYDVAGEYVPCNGWTMCNHYRMTASRAALMERYGVAPGYFSYDDLPQPDVFPKRPAIVIERNRLSGFRSAMRPDWGFPRKMRGASGKVITSQVTNVRNLDSPFWRSTLEDARQRCLVPVTSFSEYGPGPKGKMPKFWFDVPSRPIFSFAGIWRMTPGGAVFAFLTTEPNELVKPIHPKAMPVILHDEDEERWLTAPIGEALGVIATYPSQLMSVQQAEETAREAEVQQSFD